MASGLLSCESATSEDVGYQLCFDAVSQSVQVEMQYRLPASDTTIFIFGNPSFGDQQDIAECVRDIQVEGCDYIYDAVSRRLSLFPTGQETTVHIGYQVIDTGAKGQHLREMFRPVLKEDHLYCPSINLLFLPVDQSMSASLQWKPDVPFPIHCFMAPSLEAGRTWKGSTDDLLMTLFVGGKNLSRRVCKAGDIDGYIITAFPDSLKQNELEIEAFFKTYYSTIREFWGDTGPGFYTLAVLPFLDEAITHKISGIGYGPGFCAKYTLTSDRVLDEHNMFVIAHEIGHQWIGSRVSIAAEHQWFHEGFNDYQTYYNLRSSSLMDDAWYERDFNEMLRIYYTSPISTLPNEEVWKNYWTGGDYHKLPYRRGCIFAFFLDNWIQKETDGKADFKDLMRALDRKVKETGDVLTIESFIDAALEFLQEGQVREAVRRYMIQGEMIDLTKIPHPDNLAITANEGIPEIHFL